MRRTTTAIILLGLFALIAGVTGGCSTVEGLGKDIQKGGEAIERAAERSKDD
jgi:entericidin B